MYCLHQVIIILGLLSEDIFNHLCQEGRVAMVIEYTEVKQLRNVKDEVLIQNLSKNIRGDMVLLKFHMKTRMLMNMSLVVRKSVFGVSDQVRHISGCTATEDG